MYSLSHTPHTHIRTHTHTHTLSLSLSLSPEAGDVPVNNEAADPAMVAAAGEGRDHGVCHGLLHHCRGEGKETEDHREHHDHLPRHGGHEE